MLFTWNIKQSDITIVTQNGVLVGALFEPKSCTDIFGVKIGIELNFNFI
jgi:hypothetical protein